MQFHQTLQIYSYLHVNMSLALIVAMKPGPEVIKLFSCSTQLSIKF